MDENEHFFGPAGCKIWNKEREDVLGASPPAPGLPPPHSEKRGEGSRSLLSLPRKQDSLSPSFTESPSQAIKHTGEHTTQLRQCELSAPLGTELRGIKSLPSGLLLIKK